MPGILRIDPLLIQIAGHIHAGCPASSHPAPKEAPPSPPPSPLTPSPSPFASGVGLHIFSQLVPPRSRHNTTGFAGAQVTEGTPLQWLHIYKPSSDMLDDRTLPPIRTRSRPFFHRSSRSCCYVTVNGTPPDMQVLVSFGTMRGSPTPAISGLQWKTLCVDGT